MALGADWCRNAYGARQSVDLHEVTRSREKPNADNILDALHRRWRGALVTYIANTLKKRWSVFRFAKPGTWNAKLASREGM